MASKERFRVVADVHVILSRRDGNILMMTRANTGYEDGNLGLPSGHLEPGETVRDAAIREAKEETGVIIQPPDLRFAHVSHRRRPGEEGRIGFFFAADRWTGEVTNCEPHKCSGLLWADPAALPDRSIDYIADAIAHVFSAAGRFSVHGWQ